jgi:hypothetical protein
MSLRRLTENSDIIIIIIIIYDGPKFKTSFRKQLVRLTHSTEQFEQPAC